MGVQALIPKRAVERFDEGVVGQPTGARKVERNSLLIRSPVEGPTAELTAVIGLHAFGDAMTGSELLQDGHDPLAFDALVGVDSQTFSGVLVNDGERPEAPPVEECVRNEVHRLTIVPVGYIGALVAMRCRSSSFRGLTPKV